jgi:hypothetical protein
MHPSRNGESGMSEPRSDVPELDSGQPLFPGRLQWIIR